MAGAADALPISYLLSVDCGVAPDVTLRVLEDESPKLEGEVGAHRVILALRSPVFREIFCNETREKVEVKVVELKMTTVRTVRQMLDYIYNPNIYSYKIKTEESWPDGGPVQMFQISYLAEKFNLPGLTKQVQASIVMVSMMQCFLKLLPL